MNRKTLMVGLLGVALLGGGFALAWIRRVPTASPEGSAEAAAPKQTTPPKGARYVSLDKLIVMLKEPTTSRIRYAAVDLAFETEDEASEKTLRAQLSLLRSAAHESIAGMSAEELRIKSRTELVAALDQACHAAYSGEAKAPFRRVLLTRLVIE